MELVGDLPVMTGMVWFEGTFGQAGVTTFIGHGEFFLCGSAATDFVVPTGNCRNRLLVRAKRKNTLQLPINSAGSGLVDLAASACLRRDARVYSRPSRTR